MKFCDLLAPCKLFVLTLIFVFGYSVSLVARATSGPAITWGVVGMAPSTDPHMANGESAQMVLHHAFEGLVRFDGAGKLVPALATAWAFPDPLTLRFRLRPGVVFHDGQPLTAQAVVASIQRAMRGDRHAMNLSNVRAVSKVGEGTVVVALDRPDPELPRKLVDVLVVRDCRDCDSIQGKLAPSLVGTGAYRMSFGVSSDSHLVLEASDTWWDAQSNLKRPSRVDVIFYKREQDLADAVRRGFVDFVFEPGKETLTASVAAPRMQSRSAPSNRTVLVGMNHGAGEHGDNPLRIESVRHAVGASLNFPTSELLPGHGVLQHRTAGAMVAKGVNGWTDEVDRPRGHDIQRARAMLRDSGVQPGQIALDCPRNRYRIENQLCDAVIQSLNSLGFAVKVEHLDYLSLLHKIRSRKSQMYLIDGGVPTMDGAYTLSGMVRTPRPFEEGFSENTSCFNGTSYSDPHLDAAIDRAQEEADASSRAKQLSVALDLVKSKAVYLPLVHLHYVWIARADLHVAPRLDARPDLARSVSGSWK